MAGEDERLDETLRAQAVAETSRHETDARFQIVVDGVIDYAIFLLDLNGRVMTWNSGAERLKGYTAQEIIGKHFSTFYPPEAVASGWPEKELEIATREGRTEEEGWRVRQDGTRFWASVVITAVRDTTGTMTGFLKITRDLTERKMYEEEVRQSEERFRLLVEGVKDYAIFMLDPEGRITSWNEGARRIKGYADDEIIGSHFSTFYPSEALARRWPEHELRMARREGRFEDEGWRLRKDGSRFWANVVITSLYGPDGVLRGFAKVTRDLTERRKVQSLEEANQRMNEFLAMVSHELRTPLNSMLGWVRILQQKTHEPEVERGLATVARNTLAQAQLVEDLLDVSRIVSGRLQLKREAIALESVVSAAVDSVRLAAESKSIRLDVVTQPEIGRVLGDRERLQQVIWNLLSNATKFTPPGGAVSVTLERRGPLAEIRVSDTGQGIDPAFIPHVFERFRQADASSTRAVGGLGLGLAIVKHLVEAHGGTARAESEGKGRGATFIITLPLVVEQDGEARYRSEIVPSTGGFDCPHSLAGVKVLVVDDEEDAREMLAVVLGQCEADVRMASSSAEAVEIFEEWVPDVMVSDLGMPHEDGYELIRKVRQRSHERGGGVPAVALTAYARFEDRMRALGAGFQMHVAKPIEPAELVMVIHSLLEFKGNVLSEESE